MRRSTFRAAAMLVLCASTFASASGHLPVPVTTQAFKSHQACIAALRDAYEADQKQILPKKTESNGDTREVAVDTKGIENVGPDHVRYEATVWFHNGHFDAKLQGTETSHTFETRLRECKGATLHTSGSNGFTMSTWDPK